MRMPYTAVITGKGLPAVTDDWLRSTSRPVRLAQIDTTVPNVARVWNYLIGGRDNFDADRRRWSSLASAGWRIVFATWREASRDPGVVVARVRAALDASSTPR